MINRYYKTISPSLAKKRIAKLVEAERKAWSKYKETRELDSEFLTEYHQRKWLGYRESLDAMGIVESHCLED